MNTNSQLLGEWASTLSLDEVPSDARNVARRCIIDTIGVAVGGSATGVAQRVSSHVAEAYGDGSCSLLGSGTSSTAIGAALGNGVSAHALDFDDTSYAGVVHGSVIVLPAVLAASELADASGSRFLEAFIAGSETVYGLGTALSDSHYLSGWWATGTLGAIGAAAGSAKALGLDAEQATAAIGLAALQANGMIAMLGYDAKPILAGQAARLGVESALHARQGHSVPVRAFEDRRGFIALMNSGNCDVTQLEQLGKAWRLLEPGVAIKHAPVCSAAQAAIEVTQKLIKEHEIDRARISHVRCEVPHLVKISLVHDRPETPAQAQFSMTFAIGCVLAFGELGPSQISPHTLDHPELRSAMEMIEMVEAEDLNGPDYQPAYPEGARVILTIDDGKELTGFMGAPTGMPEKPMPDDVLAEKFATCAEFGGWDRERTRRVLDALWKIENARSIRDVLKGEESCVTP